MIEHNLNIVPVIYVQLTQNQMMHNDINKYVCPDYVYDYLYFDFDCANIIAI